MKLVTQAMIFAAQKHDGAVRKASSIPYILHPMEAAAVAATITDDQEVLAATVLHDVMEDCGVSYEELLARFGVRVEDLVCVTEDGCMTLNALSRDFRVIG